MLGFVSRPPRFQVPRGRENINGAASPKFSPLARGPGANVATLFVTRLQNAVVEASLAPILCAYRQYFFFSVRIARNRFRAQMPATCRKRNRYVMKAKSVRGGPQPELVIHDVVQVVIQVAELVENSAAEENVGLRDIVQAAQHDFPVEADFFFANQGLSGLIDNQIVAIDEIDERIVFERLYNCGEAFGLIEVVGVQPSNDVAGCHTEALIDGVALAAIFFRKPAEMIPAGHRDVPPENFDGTVGGGSVNYDVFQGRIMLAFDAEQRRVDKLRLVERRRNDGEFGSGEV